MSCCRAISPCSPSEASYSAYCTSKSAVDGLTKTLACEWGSKGITVNAIAPTVFRSDLTAWMYEEEGQVAVRRIQGVLGLAKKHGPAMVDEVCGVALETGATNYYRFVRRYLEHTPQLPLSLRQVDPLIRQLTHYRDLIEKRTRQENDLCTL